MSKMFNTKEQHTSQEGTIRIIISDMVKKGDSIVSYFPLTSKMVRSYCGHSLMPQYYNKFNFPIITTTKSQKYRSISLGASLVPLGLSYSTLSWIRSAFKEVSKVMRRYSLLTNIGLLVHKGSIVTSRTCIYSLIVLAK